MIMWLEVQSDVCVFLVTFRQVTFALICVCNILIQILNVILLLFIDRIFIHSMQT